MVASVSELIGEYQRVVTLADDFVVSARGGCSREDMGAKLTAVTGHFYRLYLADCAAGGVLQIDKWGTLSERMKSVVRSADGLSLTL